ncbi:MAG: rhodanese-like domain-containing protein [Pseudanabaena frigida]|uniref:Rhodanese-like domain-containing protein n=1 Tax=Pseudanabaena frigida TaxID=945775 RepID=A0A2W4VSW8_9CYAN|nr:MAG: rhodanese-like domain-containing protein [Pseudanabaena frigida]
MEAQVIDDRRKVSPILLTPDEAKSKHINLLVVDVQNPKFMTRMIPRAQRLNIDVLLENISKNKPILITCLTGQRSLNAAQQMIQRGYCKVYVLKGGLLAWQRAGYLVWLTKFPV